MTKNWSEDFELEARRHEAGTDAEQREYEEAHQEGIVNQPHCTPLRLCSNVKSKGDDTDKG